MSNIDLIIPERAADLGQFLVGRLLPFRQKRMVGPFIFIDHMGPVKLRERENFDVMPHPHIGLSTLTYLFEGNIMHRDTLGTEIEIAPGAVNWMTAGKWIVHSERTPERLRHSDLFLHGLQIWVALPKELEGMDPEFYHVDREDVPQWEQDGLQFRLVAGEAMGQKSPVPVHSRLYMLEVRSRDKRVVALGEDLYGESGLYILQGGILSDGHAYGPKQLLVAKDTSLCTFTMEAESTIFIFGGEPLSGERHIDWNFVSSSKEAIQAAKDKWNSQDFEKIKGDDKEFTPYPTVGSSLKRK